MVGHKSSLCCLSSSSTRQSNSSALSISISKRFRCYTETALAQWIIITPLVTINVNMSVAIQNSCAYTRIIVSIVGLCIAHICLYGGLLSARGRVFYRRIPARCHLEDAEVSTQNMVPAIDQSDCEIPLCYSLSTEYYITCKCTYAMIVRNSHDYAATCTGTCKISRTI